MKAQPLCETRGGYRSCPPAEATHVMLNTPGPIPTRVIPVRITTPPAGGPQWAWNGDTENPTLSPSLLSNTEIDGKKVVCHSFVANGKIRFLGDCTHELAEQTLPLLDVDWDDPTEASKDDGASTRTP